MPRQLLALSERYYRRMLYGCAILLSAAIVCALMFLGYSTFSQFRERKVGDFVAKREQIKSEVDRLSARVTQFAEMYSRLQQLYQKGLLPVETYAQMKEAGDGISLTQTDLTVVPFSLIIPPHAHLEKARLASMLLLLRQASALPMFNPGEPCVTLEGFIYTGDHRFLAMSPPLQQAEREIVGRKGVPTFIEAMSVRVDAAFAEEMARASVVQGGGGQRVLWIQPPVDAPLARPAVTCLAARIFLDRGNIATAVFSVPPSQFRQFFMKSEDVPGLFVFDGKGSGRLLSQSTSVMTQPNLLTLCG